MRWLSCLVPILLLGCACTPTRPALVFHPQALPAARVGEDYQATVRVSGNTTPVGGMSLAGGGLPEGLELQFDEQAETAHIAGRPTQAGSYALTVSAWCYGTQVSGQTAERSYTLEVRP